MRRLRLHRDISSLPSFTTRAILFDNHRNHHVKRPLSHHYHRTVSRFLAFGSNSRLYNNIMERRLSTIRLVLFALSLGSILLLGYGIGWAISNAKVEPAESASSDSHNASRKNLSSIDSFPSTASIAGDETNVDSVLYEEAGSLPPIVPDSDAWPDSNLDYSCQPSSDHPTDGYFQLSSGNRAVNEAYTLAMCETNENIQDGVWIAGNGWTQLWTRDTSFSVEQAAGLLRPDISFVSFEKCVQFWPIEEAFGANKTVWFQDECGHFG